MGLQGKFPSGLENCTSLTELDLSINNLWRVQYVTKLNLSYNSFSGEIPVNLSNSAYINILIVQHNQLMGLIPWQLIRLTCLDTLNLADNMFTGQIPSFMSSFPSVYFANNTGLCGKPLDCCATSTKNHTGVFVESAVGGALFAVIVIGLIGLILLFMLGEVSMRKKEKDVEENKWAKSLKGAKGIKVSMFDKSMSKMKFNDLMKATNDFSKENVIGTGRTGTLYKAKFSDGWPFCKKTTKFTTF